MSEAKTAEPMLATIDMAEWLKLQAVVNAAKRWAEFQEDDSLKDQETDRMLRVEALTAKAYLLAAVEAL